MKTKVNQTLWELRQILELTQAEFATMIGASKDTVASWDAGRNRLSVAFARRIAFATGVDEDSLVEGKGPPTVTFQVLGRRGYTLEDFRRYRGTTKGRSDEAGARHHLQNCADTLKLIFMAAAAGSGGGVSGQRLPGVLHAFIEWSEEVRRDFELGRPIDAQLAGRKSKTGVTLCYREWRRLARDEPARLRAIGFKDDPSKGGEEELRLEVEVQPGWAPGRGMRLPKASIVEPVVPQGKRERGKS